MEFDAPAESGTTGNAGTEPGNADVDGISPTSFDPTDGNATITPARDPSEFDWTGSGADPDADPDFESAEADGSDVESGGSGLEVQSAVTMMDVFSKAGRHSILTERVIADFAFHLRTCIFQELAAAEAGISVSALKQWMRQGRAVHDYLWDALGTYDDSTAYGREKLKEILAGLKPADWMVYKLYEEVTKAKAAGERDNLDFIARARGKDWKAAAYLLKITNRERYSDSPNTQISVKTGDENSFNLVVVDHADNMTDDEGESLEIEAEEVEEIEDEEN